MTDSTAQQSGLPEFFTSPGIVAVGILLAALIVLAAQLYITGRDHARRVSESAEQARRDGERRTELQRTEALRRCWERLVWLIDTAGEEPLARDADHARLGLGPEVALELAHGIHRDATDLGDQTLIRATAAYLSQFSLVLGQLVGDLPAPTPARSANPPKPAPQPVPEATQAAATEEFAVPAPAPAAASADESAAPADPADPAAGKGRRR